MLRCVGQWDQRLHHEQECSNEGEGAASLWTSRQGSPSSFQLHPSVLSPFYQGKKKKKKRSDCLQVFWLHVKQSIFLCFQCGD